MTALQASSVGLLVNKKTVDFEILYQQLDRTFQGYCISMIIFMKTQNLLKQGKRFR